MSSKIKKDTYITIQSWMVTDLELKGNELLIYAIIYGFSQDGESKFTGSCNYLAEWTNSSKQSVFKCLKSLVEKGYLKRIENIINGVILVDYQSTKLMGVVNKVDGGSQQSLLGGSQQSLLHNIELDNIDHNIDNIIVLEKKSNFKKWNLSDFENEIKMHRAAVNLSKDDIISFYDYWREMTPSGKMKFQLEKSWETDLRLKTWERNKSKFSKTTNKTEEIKDKMNDAFNDVFMDLVNKM